MSHDPADGFDRDFVRGFAGDQAVRLVAGFELELKSLVAEGNSGAGIKDRFVKRVLAKLASNFRQVRAEIDTLAFDAVTGGASDIGTVEHTRACCGIAFHLH